MQREQEFYGSRAIGLFMGDWFLKESIRFNDLSIFADPNILPEVGNVTPNM